MEKSKSPYKFDDPKGAFAEAEKRIQKALKSGAKKLDLYEFGLTELPQSIGRLEHLQTLQLAYNRLKSLPKCLNRLPRLSVLSLAGNQMGVLPEVLGELIHLRELYLAFNNLSKLPEFLWNLRELRFLGLSGNNVEKLGESIGQLDQLEELVVDLNNLQILPESLGRLNRLRFLLLEDNQLKTLPLSLCNIRSLTELYLHGNRALGIPPSLLGAKFEGRSSKSSKPAKPADILDYYFRTRGGKRPLNEAKLILLGRGEVGKTCLVNRLVHNRFASTSMTLGIAITQWPVTCGKDTVRLNIWDFGGQEIQHATHQFFLTERSLYLIVLNGRAGAEDEDAEYWLKFVKTFGGSSPTIVVLNKIKVQPFQMNRRWLQEKYPFIRAFVETDCKPKTKNGVPELKREIESALAAMDHVRTSFPVGWFQIKERLAQMKEPFISFVEYRKICKEMGENDVQAQERLASFLNALGIALNFREDQRLREETVLNPHWITEGVYQIITSKRLAKQKGELRPADLGIIFKTKKAYPLRMHGFLIELMRTFELCFPFHDDSAKHRYLVPDLLGKEEPALRESFPPKECLNFRYDYRLMPEGLLPRFITRTHTMSDPAGRWRTGVVLRWESSRALVKADKQERQVFVHVLGEPKKRRRLLAVIRENFDQIHAEMKEFKPTEWVALEGHPDEWVSYNELENLERKNVTELPKYARQTVVMVNVSKLLDEADVPGARKKDDAHVDEQRPLKLFISYAHEDEKWRAKLAPNLALLERESLVEVWCDLQIKPGDKWDDEIKQKLNEADIFLFLMSTDLLASDYVQDIELPIARMRHEGKTARIVPVVVRACSWTNYLGDIQGLPKAGKPVKEWVDKDQAFHDVEQGLRKTIAEVQKMRGRI